MTSEFYFTSCENCERRSTCGNIYVAVRIAESEVKHSSNPQLKLRFREIYQELIDNGYYYPDSRGSCRLSQDKSYAQALLGRMEQLLHDLRRSDDYHHV